MRATTLVIFPPITLFFVLFLETKNFASTTSNKGHIGNLYGYKKSEEYGINNFTDYSWQFAFPVSGALLGIAVTTVTGIVFGLYPAKQASANSPIEALRYE